jgi:hypothetical protein
LHPQASERCRLACVERIEAIQKANITVVDEDDEIVVEYLDAVVHRGEPGVGAKFAKWLYRLRFNGDVCERVPITRTDGDPPTYAEFPSDQALAQFDPDDRKFVAVAITDSERPPILEAVDRGWWRHRAALAAAGVDVQFLCIREVSAGS